MLYFIIVVLLVLADFFTKRAAVHFLMNGNSKEIIRGLLRFSYVENTGAAFGIMKDMRWFFILVTLIILVALIVWLEKSFFKSNFMKAGILLVVAGALGNLIDRVRLGYVIDFIDFYVINFPVFNVADCFICVGAAILCIHYLFFEKDKSNE